jgi:hypothetical protein
LEKKMKMGSYEVNIHGADDKPVADRSGGAVGLTHGEPIGIALRNSTTKRAAAIIEVDGSPIGAWIVPAYQQIVIERPAEIDRRLTFYAQGTPEAQTNMQDLVASEDQGVVRVTFKPEMSYTPPPASLSAFRSGGDIFGGGLTRGGGFTRGGDFEGRGTFDFGFLSKGPFKGTEGTTQPGAAPNDSPSPGEQADVPEGSSQTGRQGGLKAGGIGLGSKSDQKFVQGQLDINNDPTTHVVITLRLGQDEARIMPTGPTQNVAPAPFGGGTGTGPGRPSGHEPSTGEPVKAPSVA